MIDEGELGNFNVDFTRVVVAFAGAYPKAHAEYGASAEMLDEYSNSYIDVLERDITDIHFAARDGIDRYVTTYEVTASSPDIWKVIYFTGKAIFERLNDKVKVEVAQVHLTTMLGLLHLTLQQHAKLDKALLRKQIDILIRRGVMFEELGQTGAYVTYKALSTYPKSKMSS